MKIEIHTNPVTEISGEAEELANLFKSPFDVDGIDLDEEDEEEEDVEDEEVEDEEEDPGDVLVAEALRGLDEILREWDARVLGKPNKPSQSKRGDKQ